MTAAITRAAAILEDLSGNHRPVSLTELAESAGIPKSTLHGLLTDLVGTGLVRKVDEGGGYILGSRILEFAHQYLENDLLVVNFVDLASEFVKETGQIIHLGRLEGTDAVYLARRQGNQAVRLASRVGSRFPASSSAIGKSMLLLLGEHEIRDLYADHTVLPTLTPRSIDNVDELIEHLETVRSGPGYALDDEESQPGLRCFGVPLFRLSGNCFAISTTITASGYSRSEEDSIVRALLRLRTRLIGDSATSGHTTTDESRLER